MKGLPQRTMTVALAGNPNAGKTTVFNALTGARQHVGNYPGVTVETKTGTCRHHDVAMTVIDLPGTYSLTAYTAEEVVARNVIVEEKPDVVVDIMDASNVERSLFLAVQIMELGVPVVLAFNMADVARDRGIEFDLKRLSALLGAPIVPMVGSRGEGIPELLDTVVDVAARGQTPRHPLVDYGPEVEKALSELAGVLRAGPGEWDAVRARWTAIKLLENDAEVRRRLADSRLSGIVSAQQAHLGRLLGDPPEVVIADRRYGFISGACQEAVRTTIEARHSMSDRIDMIVTNRALGLPLFLLLMYGVFYLTFQVSHYPMSWLEHLFAWMGRLAGSLWPVASDSFVRSLLVDGIIAGVGGVLVFLPNIMLLFLAIALLEDSGYMARAAFIVDHLMHKIGLHGKSFIPMLIGFGCSVPAIMATRTLDSRQDRLTTMMVLPLISCGARLPIYAMIIPAFFPEKLYAPMLWSIYFIGILLAVVAAKLLRKTVLKGETVPLVMELPPYRLPTARSLVIHMWERGAMYLRKAGTTILGISIILWAINSFPKTNSRVAGASPEEDRANQLEYTVAGRLGHVMEPVLRPMGFDWKIGTSLVAALAAKEVFVAQLGILYAVGQNDAVSESLREKLRRHYTPLVGLCIMLFSLISAPCMATVVVTRRESGAWRWALLQFGGLTALAYAITTIVYQVGRAAGF